MPASEAVGTALFSEALWASSLACKVREKQEAGGHDM